MSTCTHIWTWLSAARSEAILARHPRIEETDLLLGLLAQGGPVARTLGAAGVGLARARSAATDLDDADLAGANIPVPRGLRPRRLLVSLAVVQADVDLDLAPGAEDVVFERRGRVRSDRQALLALTAGPRTASSRLLDHLGVDVPELRRRLKTGARERVAGARTVPVPRDLRREGMERALRLDHFVCAPPEVLRGILTDPDRLGQWMELGTGAVVESGAGRVVTEWRRGRRAVRLRHSLACEGESIVWREEVLTGRWAGRLSTVRRIDLKDVDGGALVRLTLFTRAFGLLGRALAPAFGNRRWGFGMRQQLMVVAGLAADDLAGLRR